MKEKIKEILARAHFLDEDPFIYIILLEELFASEHSRKLAELWGKIEEKIPMTYVGQPEIVCTSPIKRLFIAAGMEEGK